MTLSKARKRKLKQSFNKGNVVTRQQFSARKPKKTEKIKIFTLNWVHQIVKIMRKRPSLSEEIEITLENGVFLIDEMTPAYIIAE